MLSLLLRRNWKLVAGLIVADLVIGKVQQMRKSRAAKPAPRLVDEPGEETLKVSLKDLIDKHGHNRGSLAV